ncbi:hypothetical protein [Streptomyces sp. Ag109_O5-10]|uniref:hypothetical protein n=1 Tax=Streptomyces sp. Ag109_O5-10 TaxID=1855349 RepID=UPI00089557D9|nr:hypothetical protein [Streptomyces sp. Ag109_O5-10]SED88331.1 hypothetical protein SAMN05216533_0822 [Streptomyces sp. Ag109_O5-10]
MKPPKGFAPAKAGPGDGFLEAIYVGAPLKHRELPTKISTGDTVVGDDVTFPAERVVDHHVFAPSAPQLCDDDGIPRTVRLPVVRLRAAHAVLPRFRPHPEELSGQGPRRHARRREAVAALGAHRPQRRAGQLRVAAACSRRN